MRLEQNWGLGVLPKALATERSCTRPYSITKETRVLDKRIERAWRAGTVTRDLSRARMDTITVSGRVPFKTLGAVQNSHPFSRPKYFKSCQRVFCGYLCWAEPFCCRTSIMQYSSSGSSKDSADLHVLDHRTSRQLSVE